MLTEHRPGSPAGMWSATSVCELVPVLGGAAGDAMCALLARWRDRLPNLGLPTTDSACVVSWPSQDVQVGGALLDHGFVPLSVLAVRVPAAAARRDFPGCGEPPSRISTSAWDSRSPSSPTRRWSAGRSCARMPPS